MSNFSGRVSSSSTFRVPTSRPRVFNATLPHLSVARDHCRRLSREQNALSRSRDNLGRPLREQNAPSRSRDDLGRPLREQNAPSRSRDNLGRPSREQNAPSCSRDNFGRHRQAPSLYQSYLLATLVHQTSLSLPILSPGHFGTPDKPLPCTKNSHTVSLGFFFFS